MNARFASLQLPLKAIMPPRAFFPATHPTCAVAEKRRQARLECLDYHHRSQRLLVACLLLIHVLRRHPHKMKDNQRIACTTTTLQTTSRSNDAIAGFRISRLLPVIRFVAGFQRARFAIHAVAFLSRDRRGRRRPSFFLSLTCIFYQRVSNVSLQLNSLFLSFSFSLLFLFLPFCILSNLYFVAEPWPSSSAASCATSCS